MWFVFLISLLLYFAYAQFVEQNQRVDCYPQPNPTEEACRERNCIWDSTVTNNDKNVPPCYFPKATGFGVSQKLSEDHWILQSLPNSKCPYGDNFQQIEISTKNYGDVLNVRIEPYNLQQNRFEPDIKMFRQNLTALDGFTFLGKYDEVFSFEIQRKSSQGSIWDTSIGGMMFADKYIQVATYLPSDKMYGLGENVHQQLKHDFSKYKTWSMFARDEAPNSVGEDTKNLYGVHPFYMMLESDSKAHGVLILNSNAQEFTTGPGPHIVYRTIGGLLDIYFFPGPTPSDVVRQYHSFIGKPFMPPLWAFGFQLSRSGYKDLSHLKSVLKRNLNSNIPVEVVYADIDYMDRYMDFTTGQDWNGFGNYVEQLRGMGMSVILPFDPAIDVSSTAFARALSTGASFIEYPNKDDVDENNELYNTTSGTKIMLSVVWPDHHTAFPDFYDPQPLTRQWWTEEFVQYHEEIEFDGVWINMNEPAVFGTNEDHPRYFDSPDHPNLTSLRCDRFADYDRPPFQTSSVYRYTTTVPLISQKTLCMVAKTHRGNEVFYNSKNLYGLYESIATYEAAHKATRKRTVVISRSTFPGSGRYAGHSLGENSATWYDLRTSIIAMQEFNIFGIPYVGADICGYKNATTEELCLRWHQLGAFYSFSRNHNSREAPDQDPAIWSNVADATKLALDFRYMCLTYLYSAHYEAAENGGTVIRPVFFEFPDDIVTHNLSYQFMWGDSILVAPVTEPSVSEIDVYLPVSAKWYSLRVFNKETESVESGWNKIRAKITELTPVFLRGGKIIPKHEIASNTTRRTREKPIYLYVGSEVETTDDGEIRLTATGSFIYEDGDSIITDIRNHSKCTVIINFNADKENGFVKISSVCRNNGLTPYIGAIHIFGYSYTILFGTLRIEGGNVDESDLSFYHRITEQVLLIRFPQHQLETNRTIKFFWKNKVTTTKTTPRSTTTGAASGLSFGKIFKIWLLCFSFSVFSSHLDVLRS